VWFHAVWIMSANASKRSWPCAPSPTGPDSLTAANQMLQDMRAAHAARIKAAQEIMELDKKIEVQWQTQTQTMEELVKKHKQELLAGCTLPTPPDATAAEATAIIERAYKSVSDVGKAMQEVSQSVTSGVEIDTNALTCDVTTTTSKYPRP